MNNIKKSIKTILGYILVAFFSAALATGTTIYASGILAGSIEYTNTKSVGAALDDLYNLRTTSIQEILQDYVRKDEMSQASDGTPIGTIIAFSAGNAPNANYLKCEGQAVSRTEYSTLFGIIGTTYGAGNGSSTFNLPDLRGEFLRGTGTNNTTGYSGARVGSHQNPTQHLNIFIQNSDKNLTTSGVSGNSSSAGLNMDSSTSVQANTNGLAVYYKPDRYFDPVGWDWPRYYTSRPTNTSVQYCIKVK